jgi:hypothetical protein
MSDFLFDARLERAARRIAAEAVRPFDAVAIAETAIGAARRDLEDRAARRWPRAWSLAAAAIAIVTIVGVSLLVAIRPPQSSVGHPSSAPSASASASPTPPPVSESAGAAGGTWLADVPAGLVFADAGTPRRMSLVVSSGPSATINLEGGAGSLFESSFETFGVGEVRLTTTDTAADEAVTLNGSRLVACVHGDVGHYRFESSREGLILTLTLISDDCPARQAVFARSWTRSISVPNGGGVGVVDGFDPLFTVVMPAGTYVVDRDVDSRTIRQDLPELQFQSWKDPQGFVDPCDRSKGRREIAPGADAFVAYFRQLAGFVVDSTQEVTIDGYRAVHLVVHADEGASCPDGRLWEWQPKAETGDLAWFVSPGVTDSLFIVDHPAGTVMFELLPAPNSLEAQVIGSIRFLDSLPTTP